MIDRSKITLHNVVSFGFKIVRGAITAMERWLYNRNVLSRDELHFPDFLCIGAQKAGTTWLYKNLRYHPDIYLTSPKELHYFDRHYHESPESYSKHFDKKRFDIRGKVAGEITPEYGIIPMRRIRFIHEIRPDLRLIFLMRNPIDRAWSQAVMNLVEHTNRSFEEVADQEFYDHLRSDRTIKRGDYITIIDNWTAVFPEEQLYVGFLEDLAERPRQLLSDIFEHLGVTKDVDWSNFPYNKRIRTGVRAEIPDRFRRFLEDMYERDLEQLANRFDGPAQQWLKDCTRI